MKTLWKKTLGLTIAVLAGCSPGSVAVPEDAPAFRVTIDGRETNNFTVEEIRYASAMEALEAQRDMIQEHLSLLDPHSPEYATWSERLADTEEGIRIELLDPSAIVYEMQRMVAAELADTTLTASERREWKAAKAEVDAWLEGNSSTLATSSKSTMYKKDWKRFR